MTPESEMSDFEAAASPQRSATRRNDAVSPNSPHLASKSKFEQDYDSARKKFERGETRGAALELKQLLLSILIDIVDRNHRKLSKYDDFRKQLASITKDGDLDLKDVPFRDLCGLFDSKIDIFSHAEAGYKPNRTLLHSFRFEFLADLVAFCETGDPKDAAVRLGVQQLLCAVVVLLFAHVENMDVDEHYHFLANFDKLREELNHLRESNKKLTGVVSNFRFLRGKDDEDETARVFKWLKRRGMLINENDMSRNIAFKVHTFENILSTIFRGVVRHISPDAPDDPEANRITNAIIFEAGYASGLRFGWTMHELFQQESRSISLRDKVKRWCDFDSDVGFGLLELVGDVKRDNDPEDDKLFYLSFQIRLSNNFVVYQKETDQVNLCSFVAGYIQGVLEKITGQPLAITHDPDECEQFVAEQDHCLFRIQTNRDKLISSVERARSKYRDSGVATNDRFRELANESIEHGDGSSGAVVSKSRKAR